jgi:hypothetical protein
MSAAAHNRAQVLAAYGLLSLAVAAVAAITIAPAYSFRRDFADRYESLREAFGRFDAAVHAADTAAAEISAGRFSEMSTQDFFIADTSDLAGAELQNRIKNLFEERHGEVSSTSLAVSDEDAVFPRISVQSTLRCSIAALVDVVRVLETSTPVLFIDELHLQSLHQPGRVLPSNDVELDVRITVTGYRFVQGAQS